MSSDDFRDFAGFYEVCNQGFFNHGLSKALEKNGE
jgi:hypothetical protein